MFCYFRVIDESKLIPSFLIWYQDPLHLQEERRPPSVRGLDELRNLGHMAQASRMLLVCRDEGTMRVSFGALVVRGKQIYFAKEEDAKAPLKFVMHDSFQSFNECITNTIRTAYKQHCNEKLLVPRLTSDGMEVVRLENSESFAESWIGGLVLSRHRVTAFILLNLLRDFTFSKNRHFLDNCDNESRRTEDIRIANSFLVFIPCPKPKSIATFVKAFSEKKPLSVALEMFPHHEGFYKTSVSRIREESDSVYECQLAYDDYGSTMCSEKSEVIMGRLDFGTMQTEEMSEVGFPMEHDRCYLSTDISTILAGEKYDVKTYGKWGFTGTIENSEMFFVPADTSNQELFDLNGSLGKLKRSQVSCKTNEEVWNGLSKAANDNKCKLVQNAMDHKTVIHEIIRMMKGQGSKNLAVEKRPSTKNPARQRAPPAESTNLDFKKRKKTEHGDSTEEASNTAKKVRKTKFGKSLDTTETIEDEELHERIVSSKEKDAMDDKIEDVHVPKRTSTATKESRCPVKGATGETGNNTKLRGGMGCDSGHRNHGKNDKCKEKKSSSNTVDGEQGGAYPVIYNKKLSAKASNVNKEFSCDAEVCLVNGEAEISRGCQICKAPIHDACNLAKKHPEIGPGYICSRKCLQTSIMKDGQGEKESSEGAGEDAAADQNSPMKSNHAPRSVKDTHVEKESSAVARENNYGSQDINPRSKNAPQRKRRLRMKKKK